MRTENFLRVAPFAAGMLGVAHGCGDNAPDFWWVQFVAMSALLALCFLATLNKLPALSVLTALAFSAASAGVTHSWIWQSLARDSALGVPLASCLFVALVVGLALLPAMAIALGCAMVAKTSLARFAPLMLALGYPLAEMATAALLGFSWSSIGYSTLGTPLAFLLPVIGIHGVASVVMLACALTAWSMAGWMSASAKTLPWRAVAAMSSVVILLALLTHTDFWSMTQPSGHELRVRLVQPAQPLYGKFDAAQMRETTHQLVALASDASAHLIVAPESVLPHSWSTLPSDLSGPLMSVVADSDRTFLVGLFDAGADGGLLNVSVALRADSLRVPPYRYVKRHLVPVSEQRTPGLRWISDALALPYADRQAGDSESVVFMAPHVAIQTTICLDLAYGGDLSETSAVTELLVNQSNLAALPGERVRAQFTAIARARALEQRKPVLLVSNDGPTAAIDADGRLLAALPGGRAGALEAQVIPRHGQTVYAKLGEACWLMLLAFGTLGTALWPRRSAARTSSTT